MSEPACILVVYDSCRVDTMRRALPRMPALQRLAGWSDAGVEARHSYATWTIPSHQCLAAGLLPFVAGTAPAAFEYAQQFDAWDRRFPGRNLRASIAQTIPARWSLPVALRNAGVLSGAIVSMPCLGRGSPFHMVGGWEVFDRVDHRSPLARVSTEVVNRGGWDRPWFWLFNLGATHWPYGRGDLPYQAGAGGAAARREYGLVTASAGELHAAQVDALVSTDADVGAMLDAIPAGSTVIVTSDHGELFGEDGLFGHGPYPHPLLLSVPYIEAAKP